MFGVPVDPATQLPIPSENIAVTKTTWVDFIFDPEHEEIKIKLGVDTKISALNFIHQSLNKVEEIVSLLKAAIQLSISETY